MDTYSLYSSPKTTHCMLEASGILVWSGFFMLVTLHLAVSLKVNHRLGPRIERGNSASYRIDVKFW